MFPVKLINLIKCIHWKIRRTQKSAKDPIEWRTKRIRGAYIGAINEYCINVYLS